MTCECGEKNFMDKRPNSPCVFCAHKHISCAMALYNLEIGYKDINKSFAIGQLILAAWHYDKNNHELALRCRNIWLKMEKLLDCNEELNELQKLSWDLVIEKNNLN